MSGSTASIAATRPLSACVSEAISTSNSRPSRTLMIATPWSPIGPDRISTSPGCRPVRGGRHAVRHEADARGVDEQPVRGPAAHDLGVAGDDPRPGLRRRGRRRRRDEPQLLERQPLLDDVGEADRDRGRPHHRQVVERAVDRELADVPAREPDGRDDERVRGEREARARHLHDGRVVEDAAGRRRRPGPAPSTSRISALDSWPPDPWPRMTRWSSGIGAGQRRRPRRWWHGGSSAGGHRGASGALTGATCTSGSASEKPPPAFSPRPAEKKAAQVPSELTIGAPSGFCGLHRVP